MKEYSIYNNANNKLVFQGKADECAHYLGIERKSLLYACRNLIRVQNKYIVTRTDEMYSYERRRRSRERAAV